jgi:hypothetical protein
MPAKAFCGFYVAKADAELFNHASQVALVRDGKHTVLTMANDYKGDLTEFAVVVPVPTLLQKDQIHIGDPKLVGRLDSWSGPRLVEYFDPDPCSPRYEMDEEKLSAPSGGMAMPRKSKKDNAASLGVKIEAEYTIGEYDIVILSAKQSGGLQTWLTQEGYHVPAKAADALAPYIKQDMKFFVAKVNLKEQAKTGFKTLRPIQIAYDSEKFMLPIRLGMANADGPQDLIVYTLTKKGRVESTNYRTVKMPSGDNVPIFVKQAFKDVYKAIFETSYAKEDKRGIFTEYAWNAGSCDPCADEPLSATELRGLGVYWANENDPYGSQPFVTRLHVRYDRDHFPEDLVFQETGDQESYQARYVLQHPFKGNLSCDAGREYLKSLDQRHEQEAATLAALTGWDRAKVVTQMGDDAPGHGPVIQDPWYKRIWH